MKIVLAPNALKGCLTATQAAEAMARGVARACPNGEIAWVPVANGGDGLADVLVNALNGEARAVTVTGPRGDPVLATICHVPARRLAAIEMATASGLALLPKDRLDPMLTTTLGTGELIAAALDLGISHLVIGIGGSATNDGGIGMATALGARFLDNNDNPDEPGGGGGGAPGGGGGGAPGGGGWYTGAGAIPLLVLIVMIEPGMVFPLGVVPTTTPFAEELFTAVGAAAT